MISRRELCKRTHQLCRNNSYWDVARTLCGEEKKRDKTTSSDNSVTCKKCIRQILMIAEQKIETLIQRLEN